MDDKLFEKLAKKFGYRVINPSIYHPNGDGLTPMDLTECVSCGVFFVSSHLCKETRPCQH